MKRLHGRTAATAGLIAIAALFASFVLLPATAPQLRKHRQMAKTLRAWMLGASYMGDGDVVLQQRRNDCGAACLKMVLSTRHIDRDLAQLRAEARTTGRGASLQNIRLTAERAGMPGKAWSLIPNDLARAPLPAIAFVNGDHYVVIRRLVTPSLLEVDDPAIGRLQWPMKSFRRAWSGETLVFDPSWTPNNLITTRLCRIPAQ